MRDAQNQAKQAYQTSMGTQASLGSEGNQISGSLIPGLERDFQHPTGFTPQQKNNMLVAGEQGAGGALSGITGQANLGVARTGNSAGYTAALDSAARAKTRQLSNNALNVENQDAIMANKNKEFAATQLGHARDTDINGMLKAQGLLPEDVNAEVNAGKSGWFQNMTSLISALGGAAGGVGALKASF